MKKMGLLKWGPKAQSTPIWGDVFSGDDGRTWGILKSQVRPYEYSNKLRRSIEQYNEDPPHPEEIKYRLKLKTRLNRSQWGNKRQIYIARPHECMDAVTKALNNYDWENLVPQIEMKITGNFHEDVYKHELVKSI